jgi:hypothetical protein
MSKKHKAKGIKQKEEGAQLSALNFKLSAYSIKVTIAAGITSSHSEQSS